ncbi:hypothetical protein D9737_05350 [Escherichia sp. E10V4]|nr:hypothetical protein D9737_05350 [Escherichia sp. E10V4]
MAINTNTQSHMMSANQYSESLPSHCISSSSMAKRCGTLNQRSQHNVAVAVK